MSFWSGTGTYKPKAEFTWDHTICLKCGGEKREAESLCESCRRPQTKMEDN